VLVPEALLESAPEDWIEEEAPAAVTEPLPDLADRDGRRRRRGRGRGRAAEQPAAVAAPAPAVTPARPAAPAEEAARERREREKAEPRAEREYKEILINVDPRETRIAVLERGRLVELHVEREERVVGGVYKGRVCNVLPGMDCAFVDVGLDRNAFLYVGDILFEDPKAGDREGAARRTSRDVRIQDLAKPGQEILVQVTKGPRGTKGARVSTKISIPGRYLVLMPDADNVGVSRKIEESRERDRLKRIVDQFRPKGFGIIVRTEAEERSETELQQDLDYLLKAWGTIQEKNKRIHHPAVIHKDLGVILKTIRDLFGSDVDKLVLDDAEEYEKVVDVLGQLAPDLLDRVVLYDEREPLFIRYNLEEEIDRLLRRKVWLRHGAYLLIDTTEALTTFDVNTGKSVGTSSLAETILKTNLDAVEEIARQLRLRDIGGMIVLDFIDMSSSRDRQLVMRALENAFKKDRTRIKIAHISPLGLVEMTRKRTAESVTETMSHACPYCSGRGRVWSPETMAIQIEREIRRKCANEDVDAILVYASPEVAEYLIGPEGESVERLERMLRRPVYVRARHDHHIEKWEILTGDMLELEEQMLSFHGGHIVECQVAKSDLITAPRSAAWADGYFVDLANGARFQGQTIRVRLTDVRRSFALGDPVAPSTAVDRSEPI
jgi:ribonuclease G